MVLWTVFYDAFLARGYYEEMFDIADIDLIESYKDAIRLTRDREQMV